MVLILVFPPAPPCLCLIFLANTWNIAARFWTERLDFKILRGGCEIYLELLIHSQTKDAITSRSLCNKFWKENKAGVGGLIRWMLTLVQDWPGIILIHDNIILHYSCNHTYCTFIRRRQSSGSNRSLLITLLAEVHVFSGRHYRGPY